MPKIVITIDIAVQHNTGSDRAQRRVEAGLTQQRLAALTGITQATLSRYERGLIKDLSPKRKQALDAALGADEDYD